MHENLKTTLSLKPEKNTFKGEDNWQMLVPDYQYGTFFVLYGKFRGEFVDGKFIPTKCDLFLQNYQGNVTIGLISIEDIDIAVDGLLKKPVYILKVHVKPLHAKEELLNQDIKIKKAPSITQHKDYAAEIDFEKGKTYKSLKNNTLDTSLEMRIEIIYDDLNAEFFNKDVLEKSVLIDDVKFSRDGDQIFGKHFFLYQDGKLIKDKDGKEGNKYRGYINKGVIYDNRCNPKYVKMDI